MRQPAAVAGDDAVVGVQGVAQVVPGAAGDAGADPLVGRGQRQLDAAAVGAADGADHDPAPVALHVAQRLEHLVDQLRGALHVVVGRLEGHAAAAVAEARRGVGEHDVAVGGEELRGADHLRGVLGEPEAVGHQDRRLRVPAAGVARLVERGVEADRDVVARTGAHRHHPLGGAPAAGAPGRGDVVGRRGAALRGWGPGSAPADAADAAGARAVSRAATTASASTSAVAGAVAEPVAEAGRGRARRVMGRA